MTRADLPAGAAVREAVAAAERRREIVRSRIDMMRSYADATGCRRIVLLGYFGEERTEPCGNCDGCDAPAGAEPTEVPAEVGFGSGSAVDHDEFGRGTVMTVQSDRTTVLFDEHGYKTIALSARDRLRPVPG